MTDPEHSKSEACIVKGTTVSTAVSFMHRTRPSFPTQLPEEFAAAAAETLHAL
jgi:hypothetical protein